MNRSGSSSREDREWTDEDSHSRGPAPEWYPVDAVRLRLCVWSWLAVARFSRVTRRTHLKDRIPDAEPAGLKPVHAKIDFNIVSS